MAKVLIEILGGVAAVTCNPDNVEVAIIDHDDQEAEAYTDKSAFGAPLTDGVR